MATHYKNWHRVPEGLPTTDGFPLYPDYAIYPPEIVAGFSRWPEIVKVEGRLTFRFLDPSEDRVRTIPTLRTGDSTSRVEKLLGKAKGGYIDDALRLHVEEYSDDIILVTDGRFLVEIFLAEHPDQDRTPYRFIFVNVSDSEA